MLCYYVPVCGGHREKIVIPNMWKYIDRYLSIAAKINHYRCRLPYAAASGYRCDLAATPDCYLGKICKCSSLYDTRRDSHFSGEESQSKNPH